MTEYGWKETGRHVVVSGGGPFSDLMTAKCFEPEPRNKDGWHFIRHRFPIKGGINQLQVTGRLIAENLAETSALYRLLKKAP